MGTGSSINKYDSDIDRLLVSKKAAVSAGIETYVYRTVCNELVKEFTHFHAHCIRNLTITARKGVNGFSSGANLQYKKRRQLTLEKEGLHQLSLREKAIQTSHEISARRAVRFKIQARNDWAPR